MSTPLSSSRVAMIYLLDSSPCTILATPSPVPFPTHVPCFFLSLFFVCFYILCTVSTPLSSSRVAMTCLLDSSPCKILATPSPVPFFVCFYILCTVSTPLSSSRVAMTCLLDSSPRKILATPSPVPPLVPTCTPGPRLALALGKSN